MDSAENLNMLGGLTFLIGLAMTVFALNTDWGERLWILLRKRSSQNKRYSRFNQRIREGNSQLCRDRHHA